MTNQWIPAREGERPVVVLTLWLQVEHSEVLLHDTGEPDLGRAACKAVLEAIQQSQYAVDLQEQDWDWNFAHHHLQGRTG